MTKEQTIVLAVVGVLILALGLHYFRFPRVVSSPSDAASPSPAEADSPRVYGPEYLIANAPYAFSPPVMNFLPQRTAGQVGQSAIGSPPPIPPYDMSGCGAC